MYKIECNEYYFSYYRASSPAVQRRRPLSAFETAFRTDLQMDVFKFMNKLELNKIKLVNREWRNTIEDYPNQLNPRQHFAYANFHTYVSFPFKNNILTLMMKLQHLYEIKADYLEVVKN